MARRQHSSAELQRKLEARGYAKGSITAVLAMLSEQDYLNDSRFAEIFLDNLVKYKTFGFYGLKAKLLSRGISQEIIDGLLANLSVDQEVAIAQKLVGRKREQDPVKLARSLSSKGFRSEAIRQVLRIRNSELDSESVLGST